MHINLRRKIFAFLLLSIVSILFGTATVGKNALAENKLLTYPPALNDAVVSVDTAWQVTSAQPGDQVTLAVIVDVKPGYHIIADADQITPIPNFKPFPTRLTLLPSNSELTIGRPIFPRAHGIAVDFANESLMVFDGRSIIYVPLVVAKQTSIEEMGISVAVTYQACDNQVCLMPRTTTVSASLPMAAGGTIPLRINPDLFSEYPHATTSNNEDIVDFSLFGWAFSISAVSGWGLMLLFVTAAIGGLLLLSLIHI